MWIGFVCNGLCRTLEVRRTGAQTFSTAIPAPGGGLPRLAFKTYQKSEATDQSGSNCRPRMTACLVGRQGGLVSTMSHGGLPSHGIPVSKGLTPHSRDPAIFSGGPGYIWRFRPIYPIKLCLVPRKMLYFFGFGQAFTYLFEEYLDRTGITCYNGQTSERM